MQKLGLNNQLNAAQTNNSAAPKVGFWKRQFQMQATSTQRVFDWIFGVIMPIICFVFDPTVFKGNFFGGSAIFPNYKPFAYLLSFACIMAMMAWLIFGEKLRWLNGFLAGLFFLGGMISVVVGIILLPFSLFGLIILIGALGLTPLFTAVAYLRNAFRAFHDSKMFLIKNVRIYAFGFGIIFSASLVWTINSEIKNSLRWMEVGNAEVVRAEARKLRYFVPLINFNNLVIKYKSATDNSSFGERWEKEKIQAVAESYKDLTGENIEDSAAANRWD